MFLTTVYFPISKYISNTWAFSVNNKNVTL